MEFTVNIENLNMEKKEDLHKLKCLLEHENAFNFIQTMSQIIYRFAYRDKYKGMPEEEALGDKTYSHMRLLEMWEAQLHFLNLDKIIGTAYKE